MASRVARALYKTIGVLGFIFLIVFAYPAYWMSKFLDPNPWDNDEFDQDEWKSLAHDMSTWNPRGEMLQDLVCNYMSVGMKKSEVEALLGQPDAVTNAHEWYYILGMWSGFHIDYDALVIRFTMEDEVAQFDRIQG